MPLALSALALACGKEGDAGETQAETGATGTMGAETGATGTTSSPTGGPVDSTGAVVTTGAGATGPEVTGDPVTTGGDCVTGFLCNPDAGTGEAMGCDVFAQDCMEGQKCVAYGEGGSNSWNATKCVPVQGDGLPGDDCSAPEGGLAGNDDCNAESFCWDVLNNLGVCVALCKGNVDAPSCDPESVCLVSNDGVLNLCLPRCDPLLQDCAGDDLCVPNGDNFFCSQDASGDGGKFNDSCQGGNVCDKGLICRDTATASDFCDSNSTGCCQPFCEYPNGTCPNPDQECLQWFNPDDLPMNDPQLEIGICGIPL